MGTKEHPASTSLMAGPGRDQRHSEKEGNLMNMNNKKEDSLLIYKVGKKIAYKFLNRGKVCVCV